MKELKPFVHKTGIVGNSWVNPETPHNYKGSLIRHITIEKIQYYFIDVVIRRKLLKRFILYDKRIGRFIEFPFRFICGLNCNFPIRDVIICTVNELLGRRLRFKNSPYLIKEEYKKSDWEMNIE